MSASALITHLSRERLDPYIQRAGGDELGLEFYHWDSQVGAEFHIVLGYAEVILRNALCARLRSIATTVDPGAPWYIALAPLLDGRRLDDIDQARARAVAEGRAETEGRVIAELSFGFWRYLVSARYDRTLWRAGLSKAFPNLDVPLRHVSKLLYRLNQVRNRICHHEPVFNRDLHKLRQDIDQLLDWIDPSLTSWTQNRCRVATMLREAPARIGP